MGQHSDACVRTALDEAIRIILPYERGKAASLPSCRERAWTELKIYHLFQLFKVKDIFSVGLSKKQVLHKF